MSDLLGPGSEFLADLNAALASGADLQKFIDTTEPRLTGILYDRELFRRMWVGWASSHAGDALVAYLENGEVTSVQEMPDLEARTLCALEPETLIIAAWGAA